jgi:hypothetical protein
VFADPLGQEQFLRDHAFSQFLCALHEVQEIPSSENVPGRVYLIPERPAILKFCAAAAVTFSGDRGL